MPERQPQPKVQTIAYLVEVMNLSDEATIAAFLNQKGAEGWELVAMRQTGFTRDVYIFKQIK